MHRQESVYKDHTDYTIKRPLLNWICLQLELSLGSGNWCFIIIITFVPTAGSVVSLGSKLTSLSESGPTVFLHKPVPLSSIHVSFSSLQYLTVFLPKPAPLSSTHVSSSLIQNLAVFFKKRLQSLHQGFSENFHNCTVNGTNIPKCREKDHPGRLQWFLGLLGSLFDIFFNSTSSKEIFFPPLTQACFQLRLGYLHH